MVFKENNLKLNVIDLVTTGGTTAVNINSASSRWTNDLNGEVKCYLIFLPI